MNFKSFSKLAGISAIAMIAAMHATDVSAQYTIGTVQTVDFTATVDNTITVAVTDGTFGTIAAMGSAVAADVATATLPAAGPAPQVIVDDHSTGFGTAAQAHIVGNDALPGSAAVVAVTNAFIDETMYVTFENCQNLTLGPRNFPITAVTTSLPGATPYNCTGAMATGHVLTVDNTGAGTFYVGASITTDATSGAYPDGVYTGSVDMRITY